MRLPVHLVIDSGSQAEHVANGNCQKQNGQNRHLCMCNVCNKGVCRRKGKYAKHTTLYGQYNTERQ